MNGQRSIDVSNLPPFSVSSHAPVWWGQLLMAAIEGTMFCILIAVYFYIRLSVDVWPPPGVRLPQLTLETLALLPLAVSTIGSYWASEAAKKNDRQGMLSGMTTNVGFGFVSVAMRIAGWSSFNFNWASDAHGSIVWTILGLHTFDVVADLLFTLALIAVVRVGRCGPKQRQGVHVDSVVWYFLVATWVPLYLVVYWGPRLVGGRS